MMLQAVLALSLAIVLGGLAYSLHAERKERGGRRAADG